MLHSAALWSGVPLPASVPLKSIPTARLEGGTGEHGGREGGERQSGLRRSEDVERLALQRTEFKEENLPEIITLANRKGRKEATAAEWLISVCCESSTFKVKKQICKNHGRTDGARK